MTTCPKPLRKFTTIFILLTYSSILLCAPAYSEDLSNIEQEILQKNSEITEKKGILATVENRIKEINNSNYSLSQKIDLVDEELSKVQKSIDEKEAEIKKKSDEITQKQKDLAEKKALLDQASAELYMKSRYSPSDFFLSFSNWGEVLEKLFIKRNIISVLKDEVEKINGEFASLEEAKADLDKQKKDLDEQKNDLDSSYKLLAEERNQLQKALVEQYAKKNSLSAEITDLNAKVSQLQEALIASRSSGLIHSGGYTTPENGTSISQAPDGYFGVFSIGAYTHRNGMSQWGAKARADAGQSYIDILNAYYPSAKISTGSIMYGGVRENIVGNISVEGYGELSFEDNYLMGIQEVPESWPMEVLKAQAIAARTYAINYTGNGRRSICTSQSCQVFGTPIKTGAWKDAVLATRGMVLVDKGSETTISAQFAAVHGGWGNNVKWDTVSGNGNDWFNDAWEKLSGVTWFYKSWYRNGYSANGEACGHSPFLSQDEMLTIVNAYFVKNNIGVKGNVDKSRLLPSDYGRCPGRDTDYGRRDKVPYTLNEIKSLLTSPVNIIYSVGTSLSEGSTTSVNFYTDRGYITISGMGFKDIYNQIAPGHMRIQQQSGYAYFNVEKK